MRTIYHWLGLVLLICLSANASSQTCCESDTELTICYLSATDYCFSNAGSCREYSLDGSNMNNALAVKLVAPENFGENGIVDCEFELKKLPINLTSTRIDDCGCDIIFMPAVFIDPSNNQVKSESTFIPMEALDAVYDWSQQCTNHLVIVSQGEATRWGYEVENTNENPNIPLGINRFDVLFDGPFGKIPDFEQGGSFQGVFAKFPSSGYEVLANDVNGNPTLAYDNKTGDLIAGDIGIFCRGPGDVSGGPMIVTNNDVFVANLFALACELALGTRFVNRIEELCDDNEIMLPNGEIATTLGIFTDTLATSSGCDSIINVEVVECVEVEIPNIFSPNNDGRNDFFIPIGSDKIEILQFQIFNRWGQMVYNNDAPTIGWDGTFNGKALPTDVFVYQITYRKLNTGEQFIEQGDLTLLR